MDMNVLWVFFSCSVTGMRIRGGADDDEDRSACGANTIDLLEDDDETDDDPLKTTDSVYRGGGGGDGGGRGGGVYASSCVTVDENEDEEDEDEDCGTIPTSPLSGIAWITANAAMAIAPGNSLACSSASLRCCSFVLSFLSDRPPPNSTARLFRCSGVVVSFVSLVAPSPPSLLSTFGGINPSSKCYSIQIEETERQTSVAL